MLRSGSTLINISMATRFGLFGSYLPRSPLMRPNIQAAPVSSSYGRWFSAKPADSAEVSSVSTKSDEEIIQLIQQGKLKLYRLEKDLNDTKRAVSIRRKIMATPGSPVAVGLKNLPYQDMNYDEVDGRCCENVVGYIQIPVGTVGPLLLNGKLYTIPLATTEGALVASTHRGAKAITESGGAHAVVVNNGMTRAPVLRTPSARHALQVKEWLENEDNFHKVAERFNRVSRFARLLGIKAVIAGRNIYLRFKSKTGDAMGMNMVSKGTEQAVQFLETQFPFVECLSLSGNMCVDKKPSAINWIEGRGKSVVCEATIKGEVLRSTLKTSVLDIVDLNISKNLVGSAMAGSIGGYNAHASNLVSAIFLATGQDPAQNIESSHCMTLMESTNEGRDLYVSVTMPSIEVGTIGGGTHLRSQSACLDVLGIRESSDAQPGQHSESLAQIVAATVLAGELSLMSALSSGDLMRAHRALNSLSKGTVGSTP